MLCRHGHKAWGRGMVQCPAVTLSLSFSFSLLSHPFFYISPFHMSSFFLSLSLSFSFLLFSLSLSSFFHLLSLFFPSLHVTFPYILFLSFLHSLTLSFSSFLLSMSLPLLFPSVCHLSFAFFVSFALSLCLFLYSYLLMPFSWGTTAKNHLAESFQKVAAG